MAYVVVGMSGRAEEGGEAVAGFRFSLGGVWPGEVFGGLLAHGGGGHGDGAVEVGEDLLFGKLARIVEFAVAIAQVAGASDLRGDVVIQIAGEMQEQVADAIAVGIRLEPKLVGRERINPLVHASANFFVVSGERGCDELAEV